jgi:hypothetical protein
MKTDFRPVMQALFAHLKAAAVIDFTTAEADSSTLTDVGGQTSCFPACRCSGRALWKVS